VDRQKRETVTGKPRGDKVLRGSWVACAVGILLVAMVPARAPEASSPAKLRGNTLSLQVTTGAPTVAVTGQQLLAQASEQGEKDFWDKLEAVSGIIQGVLVALIGGLATYIYNKRQRAAEESAAQRQRDAEEARSKRELAVRQVETVRAFFPNLGSAEEREKEAALLAISALGNPELATKLAGLYKGAGATSALAKLATGPDKEAAFLATDTLRLALEVVRPAVVEVRAGADRSSISTGFAVRPDGLVVTTDYAIFPDAPVTVRFADGNERSAAPLGIYRDLGVTLLKVEADDIPYLTVAPLLRPEDAGVDRILVVGFSGAEGEMSLALGGLTGAETPSNGSPGKTFLVADLKTAPGFAGAPVVNLEGRVIAMNYARHEIGVVLLPGRYIIDALQKQ
jgi:hypothetical protein